MSASTPTPASSVTVKASTSTASKLKNVLDLIAGFASAELPIILELEHNPNTQAETAAGVLAAQAAQAVVDGIGGGTETPAAQ